MIQSGDVFELLDMRTRNWMRREPPEIPQVRPMSMPDLLSGLHECNFYSWKADDRSRGDLAPEIIVRFKRDLDASNLMRNHFMEEIDRSVVEELRLPLENSDEGALVNSETVGQMLDRMSVLTLKKHFAAERLAGAESDSAAERINRQLSHVAQCYDRFVEGLRSGGAYMLAYRQYKMYRPD